LNNIDDACICFKTALQSQQHDAHTLFSGYQTPYTYHALPLTLILLPRALVLLLLPTRTLLESLSFLERLLHRLANLSLLNASLDSDGNVLFVTVIRRFADRTLCVLPVGGFGADFVPGKPC